jgi:hypothetical protein
MKAPSTNIQHPEKLQAPSFKQARAGVFWRLKLDVSLDVGAWNLELL